MCNSENKQDVFDRMMKLPILRIFEPFYSKHKEVLMYLFFGGLSFILNVLMFALFNVNVGLNELLANIVAWIITVIFVYITNRIWVFESHAKGSSGIIKEIIAFFWGRLATLILEEVILLVFISWLGMNSMIIKIIAQVVVIVSNYIISKLVVFKKGI